MKIDGPIIILNLIKNNEEEQSKELPLNKIFEKYMDYIDKKNSKDLEKFKQISYHKYDFFATYSKNPDKVIEDLQDFSSEQFENINLFHYESITKTKTIIKSKQNGIYRSPKIIIFLNNLFLIIHKG